jgi:hypothetical protein
VYPSSQNVYLSILRRRGDEAIALLVKIAADGALSAVSLEAVPFAQTAIADAPAPDDDRKD